ncbi:hypothetical protein DFH09DRAFT_1158637, partial [Mycena vulgaris]
MFHPCIHDSHSPSPSLARRGGRVRCRPRAPPLVMRRIACPGYERPLLRPPCRRAPAVPQDHPAPTLRGTTPLLDGPTSPPRVRPWRPGSSRAQRQRHAERYGAASVERSVSLLDFPPASLSLQRDPLAQLITATRSSFWSSATYRGRRPGAALSRIRSSAPRLQERLRHAGVVARGPSTLVMRWTARRRGLYECVCGVLYRK